MNSSRLRSAIEAPKLAITTMIDWPRALSRANSTASSASAISPVSTMPASPATISGQPKDSGPSGAVAPNTAPIRPTSVSVA